MNKIYIFAIASILAIPSILGATFATAVMAQAPTVPSGDVRSTIGHNIIKHNRV